MPAPQPTRKRPLLLFLFAVTIIALMFGCGSIERKLLFFPSHHSANNGLTPLIHNGQTIAFAREVPSPRNIWLLFHGNAGQAADRGYALDSCSPDDSVYILEYPGYGQRSGSPGKASFNNAAREAYLHLRQKFPNTPVCAVGESIGSGPACQLATINPPPNKIVLITPFNQLADVARDHFPAWIVKLILTHNWNNAASLAQYKGPIDIFAADRDEIIHPRHARSLTNNLPTARLIPIPTTHNDWSSSPLVKIRNP